MAKIQTRRSISIRGTTYATVRAFCDEAELSMSQFIEARMAEFFGEDVVSLDRKTSSSRTKPSRAKSARTNSVDTGTREISNRDQKSPSTSRRDVSEVRRTADAAVSSGRLKNKPVSVERPVSRAPNRGTTRTSTPPTETSRPRTAVLHPPKNKTENRYS